MTARRPLTLYGASTVKRSRRTRGELAALDAAIIAAVAADHPVTLRGVYYRVVSAGAVEKTELGYRAVGRRLLELRRAKVIPYSHITDGTRWVLRPETYADTDDALDALAASYRRMLWRDQRVEVHLFSEKDAITGVVESVTARWDVPLGVLRGHCSESFAYKMAEAIDAARKVVYVYQLGDHDPSGADAWRDFQVKVTGFLRDLRTERIGQRAAARLVPAVFERIAVTEEQIGELNLPTRPTKTSDPRSRNFTGESVEVDAIPAPILRDLVEHAITQHINPDTLALHREVEAQERAGLEALAGRWSQ